VIEQISLSLYYLDPQSFLLAAHYMYGFELAALYTLQHGLASDPPARASLRAWEASPPRDPG
jgi:hypothetical protein